MITDDELRMINRLHDEDCPDRTCEPVHYAGHYLDRARELLAQETINPGGTAPASTPG